MRERVLGIGWYGSVLGSVLFALLASGPSHAECVVQTPPAGLCVAYLMVDGHPYPHGTGCLNDSVIGDYDLNPAMELTECRGRFSNAELVSCVMRKLKLRGVCAGNPDLVALAASGKIPGQKVTFAQHRPYCSVELNGECAAWRPTLECPDSLGPRGIVNCLLGKVHY